MVRETAFGNSGLVGKHPTVELHTAMGFYSLLWRSLCSVQ